MNVNVQSKVQNMVVAALLCAIGIAIPMFCPKIIIGPMSFTLASHVAIFIAMFISPPITIAVCLGTSVGFLFAGLPIVVTLRAVSHLVFAIVGAYLLKKRPELMAKSSTSTLFGLLCGLIHAGCETVIVSAFYFGGAMGPDVYKNGYFVSVVLLVCLGTLVHSMVDYFIAVFVWKPVSRVVTIPVSVKPPKKQAVVG